jgi:hypothetical protein
MYLVLFVLKRIKLKEIIFFSFLDFLLIISTVGLFVLIQFSMFFIFLIFLNSNSMKNKTSIGA